MSNLLDKASIILTPTAYNNGEALCVKPSDGSGDFDFSRNSAATRVNAQGLVENVQILSSNLVQNGDFSEEGAEEVSNGSFTNGSTDWNLGTGWSIGEDKAVLTNVGYNINCTQANVTTIGQYYKIEFTILDYISGQIRISLGGNATSLVSANGTYVFYLQATANNLVVLQALGGSGTNLSITNISVKEVGQNWNLGSGWSIGNGVAISDGVSADSNLNTNNIGYSVGDLLKVSFSVSNVTFGTLQIGLGATQTYSGITDGDYEFITTATRPDGKVFFKSILFDGSITNISVIEITDDTNLPRINYEGFSYQDALGSELVTNGDFATDSDWIKGTGITISNGQANFTGVSGQYLSQDMLTSGKSYKLTFNVTDYTSGTLTIFGGSGNNISSIFPINSTGIYTGIFISGGTNNRLYFGSTFNGSIDNVSVKEYLGQEVVPDSGCGSWLFEPQTTQLLPYSEDYSQSSWSKGSDISIESGYLAPDGNNTAYKVTKTGGGAPYLSRNQSLITTTTRSIYARTVSGTGTATLLSHNSNTNNIFTLTEQWQRFELSDTASSSGLTSFYAADFRGSGTLTEYLVWGANATNDQDYATSYIPSNGSQVTRNQDLCNNGGSLASINSTEGTLYFEGSALANTTSFRVISLSDTTNSNAVAFVYRTTPNDFTAVVKSGGATSLSKTTILADVTDTIKAAISYKLNDLKFYVNGVLMIADTSGNAPIGLNTLQFTDANGTSNKFFGKTKALAVWKEALSDQELTELTTI